VREPGGSEPLLAALDELAALGTPEDLAALDELRTRLGERRLRVLVAGEAKRGKSTLVNALLGQAVLPAGVTPLTALATTVRYGNDAGIRAAFADGHAENLPLSALEDLVTERRNPGNRRNIGSVTVRVDAPILAHGVELVDTPGTGSVYAHNTAAAEAALETMDAGIFVLAADPPASASERELMARVADLSVTMFVVLNKADYLTGTDLPEALEFTTSVASEAARHPVQVYPLSARRALSDGTDPGFAAFRADFSAYLEQGRAADLQRSAAGHARRLAVSLRDETGLARRAIEMRSGDAAERVAEFGRRLAAVTSRREEAADLIRAESARMLARLNEAAEQAVLERTGDVAIEMDTFLGGPFRSAGAADTSAPGGPGWPSWR
jgi:GTP-binding protein EngB required for normal cell division